MRSLMRPVSFSHRPHNALRSQDSAPLSLPRKRSMHDPLTEPQIEKIREAGIDPNERIKLYIEYLDDHVNAIKGLTNRGKSDARVHAPRQ